MITSTFGRIFLDAYNEKYGTQYDAKTFFVEQYWPLFFDHNKYMMTAGNSPLENPKISWKDMLAGKKPYEISQQRKQRLDKLMSLIDSGEHDNKCAIDRPTAELTQPTCSQVTNINIVEEKNDLLLSWIGAGLALGVEGGLSILFNNKQILLDIFEGWRWYRKVLNSNEKLKGNQISTWNGSWLTHRYDRLYDASNPMANFNPYEVKDEVISIKLTTWTKLVASISKYHVHPKMLGYVFNLGQMNTTIGFIPFSLNHIRRISQLYVQLYGIEEYRQAQELFGTADKLYISCQQGAIGIMALAPKGLKEYITKAIVPKGTDLEKKQINFHTYIIWILAMLNNQELWDKAQTFASALKAFSESGEKGRRDRVNLTNEVLSSTNKRNFIDKLAEAVALVEDKMVFIETAKLVNEMPTDNVPYFLTLIRFQYAANK